MIRERGSLFLKDSAGIYRVPEFGRLPWLVHGFGTRSANLPPSLTTLKQVHSTTCVFAAGRTGQLGQGDALLENTPGCPVAVKTADCLPILLVDEQNRAVAAVHAGWRGTVGQIVLHSVDAMRRQFGSKPAELCAAIGPGIGVCCYEVGPEVAQHFGKQGRTHVDLTEANREQLRDAGLAANRIYSAGLCTKCLADEFHSYRRDKEAAGRMYSFAGIAQAVK
ncbi:MAG: peptidoglycan editing factor PgeF [Terriglobia bacterium]|nr:MAG: peptidoglycan editing factor PgeF [Terriglobia bacterium]